MEVRTAEYMITIFEGPRLESFFNPSTYKLTFAGTVSVMVAFNKYIMKSSLPYGLDKAEVYVVNYFTGRFEKIQEYFDTSIIALDTPIRFYVILHEDEEAGSCLVSYSEVMENAVISQNYGQHLVKLLINENGLSAYFLPSGSILRLNAGTGLVKLIRKVGLHELNSSEAELVCPSSSLIIVNSGNSFSQPLSTLCNVDKRVVPGIVEKEGIGRVYYMLVTDCEPSLCFDDPSLLEAIKYGMIELKGMPIKRQFDMYSIVLERNRTSETLEDKFAELSLSGKEHKNVNNSEGDIDMDRPEDYY